MRSSRVSEQTGICISPVIVSIFMIYVQNNADALFIPQYEKFAFLHRQQHTVQSQLTERKVYLDAPPSISISASHHRGR